MNTRKSIVLVMLVAFVALVGCASTATIDPATVEAADYGPYPENYTELTKDYFQSRLKDPNSAQYRFTEPYQAYLRAAPVAGGKPTSFGYVVDVGVNAKNSFGGYTGEKRHRLFVKNSVVVGEIYPNPWFKERWYQE